PTESPVDLYQSRSLSFKKEEAVRGPGVGPGRGGKGSGKTGPPALGLAMAELSLNAGPDTEGVLTHLDTNRTFRSFAGKIDSDEIAVRGVTRAGRKLSVESEPIFPGSYEVKMREGGVTLKSRKFTLRAGEQAEINLLDHKPSKVRDSILAAVP